MGQKESLWLKHLLLQLTNRTHSGSAARPRGQTVSQWTALLLSHTILTVLSLSLPIKWIPNFITISPRNALYIFFLKSSVSNLSHRWLFQAKAGIANGPAPACPPSCDLKNVNTCRQPTSSKPAEFQFCRSRCLKNQSVNPVMQIKTRPWA